MYNAKQNRAKDGSLRDSEWKVLWEDSVPDMLMLWCMSQICFEQQKSCTRNAKMPKEVL